MSVKLLAYCWIFVLTCHKCIISGKTSRGLHTYLAPGVLLLPLGDKKFVLAWRTFFKAKAFRSSNQWKTEFYQSYKWTMNLKASQKVGVLVRLCNLIPCNAKLLLYKSSILPHLTYCHLVWHFCYASDQRKLEWIQERALRAVYKTCRSASYQELLDRTKLPT